MNKKVGFLVLLLGFIATPPNFHAPWQWNLCSLTTLFSGAFIYSELEIKEVVEALKKKKEENHG